MAETTEHLTEQEAMDFFSEFYSGVHHIPGGRVKPCGHGWSINHDRGSLSSFDFNALTRLVIMAHEQCVRVDVDAIRNRIMQTSIWKRQRDGDITSRHPTIEQAIEKFRSTSNKKVQQ